jgi:predicted MPP superfamily phosphohydrolase
MTPRDFTHRRSFPGTLGNPFDKVLRILDSVDNLPAPIFAALLFVLASVASLFHSPSFAFLLWLFCLGDWALLAALPRARKSFGPAKPSTLSLACLRVLPGALPFPLALILQIIGTALVVYGFWIEPHRLTLTRQTLVSHKLKSGAPLRLLHLGDLHIERFTKREQHLLDLVQSVTPDVIVYSGDFLNLSNLHDREAWDDARRVLRDLHAPLGVYVVTGSPAVDLVEVVPHLLGGLPNIRWLRDEKITLEHDGQRIDLVGITCTHKPFVDGPRLRSTLDGQPQHLTILLYHTPDLAPEAAAAGIDLQLSGHTHGGQVRLPLFGALFSGSLYGKRFEVGRMQVGSMTLYVTRGIGMEGKGAPRVRFLCPPEVVLWEIGAA